MPSIALVEWHLLDPRPAGEAAAQPIADAVNIPLAELPDRTHELPPRGEEVPVIGPRALAEQAVACLTRNGRRAVVQPDFHYSAASDPTRIGRLWRPNPFLAEVLPQLTPGRALDLACGCGREAVFMAACGWNVTAVDVLPDALERGRDLARRCAPALEPIEWRQVDLEANLPALGEPCDLIVAFRYLHRPLLGHLPGWLRPAGSLVCETFTTTHRERHGRPEADRHVLQPGELPGLLAGLGVRHYSEAWRGSDHTARVWAVKP
jgi:SAM-dependent methyltransferase